MNAYKVHCNSKISKRLKYLIHTCTIDFIVNYKGWRVKFNAAFTRCEHFKLILTRNVRFTNSNTSNFAALLTFWFEPEPVNWQTADIFVSVWLRIYLCGQWIAGAITRVHFRFSSFSGNTFVIFPYKPLYSNTLDFHYFTLFHQIRVYV